MKKMIARYLIAGFCLFSSPLFAQEPPPAQSTSPDRLVSLDFDNVDLPVLIKFIGELTSKNFVIDEQVRGKVTIFSPVKIPASKAYDVFLSVLNLKGFTVVPDGAVYQILPQAASPPARSTRMYTVQYADAEEVSKVMLGIIGRAGGQPIRSTTKVSREITGNVQMVTDKGTNRLIITASDDDYKIVEEMIKQLDVKRRQVYVEAVILELSADKLKEIGTDLGAIFGYTPNGGSDVIAGGSFNQSNPGEITGLAKDLGIGLRAINVRGFLRMLQSTPETNVLSTPQILTTDRQKAEIVVAQNVPFPGASTVGAGTGGTTQTTVERKDVGMIFRLTPTIMEEGMVKLDLYQEISSVVDASSDKALGPTTNKRSATTNVIVHDGQTAVIGGLIKDNVIRTKKSIPFLWLDQIPIIKWFFASETKRTEKTNLMIFVTPYIVPDGNGPNNLDELRQKKVTDALNFMKKNSLQFKTNREEQLNGMINAPK